MKHVICSIYDTAVEAYMRPFTAQSEGQAIRLFTDEVCREGSEMSNHPEDYALFAIGTFDDHSGMITQDTTPKNLARAHEVKAQMNRKED